MRFCSSCTCLQHPSHSPRLPAPGPPDWRLTVLQVVVQVRLASWCQAGQELQRRAKTCRAKRAEQALTAWPPGCTPSQPASRAAVRRVWAAQREHGVLPACLPHVVQQPRLALIDRHLPDSIGWCEHEPAAAGTEQRSGSRSLAACRVARAPCCAAATPPNPRLTAVVVCRLRTFTKPSATPNRSTSARICNCRLKGRFEGAAAVLLLHHSVRRRGRDISKPHVPAA